jgi:hypothetical protein
MKTDERFYLTVKKGTYRCIYVLTSLALNVTKYNSKVIVTNEGGFRSFEM